MASANSLAVVQVLMAILNEYLGSPPRPPRLARLEVSADICGTLWTIEMGRAWGQPHKCNLILVKVFFGMRP